MIISSCKKVVILPVMVLIPPERLNHLLGRFRNVLSKPQFENFRSVMFGLIRSGCKEHDVKSMRDTAGETKCQSKIITLLEYG
jgi:hypothetical protein